MNATAERAYSFRGASPADEKHKVRQMRSIWSAGEKLPNNFQFQEETKQHLPIIASVFATVLVPQGHRFAYSFRFMSSLTPPTLP